MAVFVSLVSYSLDITITVKNLILHLVKDVAKISTNKLSTLVFDFTFISLHVSTLRQGPLQVSLHFKLFTKS